MFAIFNFALVFYSYFLIKETKGLSLEEMDIRKLLSVCLDSRTSLLTVLSFWRTWRKCTPI
jgi:hypothetical protein